MTGKCLPGTGPLKRRDHAKTGALVSARRTIPSFDKTALANCERLETRPVEIDGSVFQAAKTVCVAMASSSNAVEMSRMLMTPIRP